MLFLQKFVYALPRKEGYEFFLGQWAGQELHFTSLINVQVKKSCRWTKLHPRVWLDAY